MNLRLKHNKNTFPKGRVFLFADETGDLGHPYISDSSAYYQISFFIVHRDSLKSVYKYISAFRYFKEAYKELKVYYRDENKIIDILRKLAKVHSIQMISFVLNKKQYIKKYMISIDKLLDEYNPNKFRNHVIKQSLRYTFDSVISLDKDLNNIEIIFDRYYENIVDELSFREYIQDKHTLPSIEHISQVDSEYCEGVQVADMIGRFVKSNYFDNENKDIDFVKIVELT